MTVLSLSLSLSLMASRVFAQTPVPPKPITLLERLPGSTSSTLPVCLSNPFSLINAYLQPMMTWGIGIAAGLAVLMIIVGGLQMMLSGGSPEGMSSGRQRVFASIFGLIFLVFSAALLNFLNAYFFQLRGVGPAAPGC